MTRQIEDHIDVDGEPCRLRGWPLEEYLKKRKPKVELPPLSSSCHRRYKAFWRMVDEKLYLVSIMAGSEASEEHSGNVRLSMFIEDYFADVFPDGNSPVFAKWVSGEFYTESMDETTAEMLTFKKGLLTARAVCEPFDPYRQYQEGLKAMFARLEREKFH